MNIASYIEICFQFVLTHMKPIELFVFWYPIVMGLLWMIGGVMFYFRLERRSPLPLTETPFVSILVPAFNEADNIANTIARMQELNYPNFEIIIINDGSSDDSPALEAQLAEQYSNVRFVNLQENNGKANALYLGFIAARGEYLVCVDGDSYLDPDCLRYMIPHFTTPHNSERVGAVTGNPRVRNRSSLLAKIQVCEYASIISLIKRTQRIWGKVMTVSGVVVAFRKRALIDCGMWDRDLITEDIGVTWKLEKSKWDVRYEPNAICWMLVPETLKGLMKQRRRWAKGGQEVMFRHVNIFKHWHNRRMYPIFFEQALSLTWVLAWLALTLTELIKLSFGLDSYIPYIWRSQYIAVFCLLQIVVALCLERKYDRGIFRNIIVTAWYPALYWIVTSLMSLAALPETLFRKKKKLATWRSPDRGIDTKQTLEKKAKSEKRPDDIIDGKQHWGMIILEVIFTISAWAFILVYLAYMVYGTVCIHRGQIPASIWIYNLDVVLSSYKLMVITLIVFLILVVVLLLWKTYNKKRFGNVHRRQFRPEASTEEVAAMFGLPVEQVTEMQHSKITVLPVNIISGDFAAESTNHSNPRQPVGPGV